MRLTFKRLLRLSAGYSIVTFIGPIFTVLLTPLYTQALSPADYGVVDVLLTLGGFIGTVAVLGLDQALNGYFFQGDARHQADLIITGIVMVLATSATLALSVAVFAEPIATWLFADRFRMTTVYLLAIYLLFAPQYSIVTAAMRLSMNIQRVNAIGLAYLATYIVCNVLFILVFRFKATGILGANLAAMAAGSIVGLLLTRRHYPGAVNRVLAGKLAKTGFGLMLSALGFAALASADRLILTQHVTPTMLGLYAIGNKLASLVGLLVSLALSAWVPQAIQLVVTSDATQPLARMTEVLVAASSIAALSVGVFASEILRVFTREAFTPASSYVLLLAAYTGPVIMCAALFSISLHARRKTNWLVIAYAAATLTNLGLNLWLVPRFGVWGATWATIASGVVLASITLLFGHAALRVDYRWGRILTTLLVYSGLIAAHLAFPALQDWRLKVASVGVLVGAIFISGIVTFEHLRILWRSLTHRSRVFLSQIP